VKEACINRQYARVASLLADGPQAERPVEPCEFRMNDLAELERRAAEARAYCEQIAAKRPSSLADFAEYRVKRNELLELERTLALARGSEVALPFDWPAGPIDHSADPVIISRGLRTALLYAMAGSAERGGMRTVLAVFEHCRAVRSGGPNDEGLEGHPLFGCGLDAYGVYVVGNSAWLRSEEQMNRVHPQHAPSEWTALNHYLTTFHDRIVEFLARSVGVELVREPISAALARANQRLGIP
jgi:hypothetical protein